MVYVQPTVRGRLERIGETSTQSPCGLGQALVMALLTQWSFDGYIRWLRGLGTQYKLRRDFFVDCLAEEFELFPAPGTASGGPAALLLCVPARAGRRRPFAGRGNEDYAAASVIRAAVVGHVRMGEDSLWGRAGQEGDGSVLTSENQFWQPLAKVGVLVAPGWFFSPETHTVRRAAPPMEADRQIGHVRLSYTLSDVSAGLFRLCSTPTLRIDGDLPDGGDAPGRKDFHTDAQGVLSCLGFINNY